ncbi:MAG: endonuclease/exonuclease/phosphatase family protein [Deltaproteobacteria bacterium]|nr:endonuclease/exonuclease/phosphatase family protein [Deltaproteobacteria bacterium]MBW2447102.1 endonuclease/exonuclease/phosphatase family protein [Deltaproteobacteria bacterium]
MSRETLRLASLNVWALPLGIARHVAPRMKAIGERIGELDVDVVALQEVWTEEARAALVAGGRDVGLEHIWHNPAARGGSGLLFLSRRPFVDVEFHAYTLRGLPQRVHHGDYWGGKGFALARLETEGGPVTLLDTHLHAQYTDDPIDEYRGMRTGQAIQLAATVRGRPDPIVALGDFNLRTGNPDHAVLMGLSGFTDVALALDNPQDTILADHPYRGGGHSEGERIDYAFVRTGQHADAIPTSIEREFDARFEVEGEAATYSDHAGLLVEVDIASGAERALPGADPVALRRARSLLAQGRSEAQRRRGVERSLAVGAGALAVAALPVASQLRASRRGFLAGVAAGLGVACLPSAGLVATLSEVAVPAELAAYDEVEALLDGFEPA